MRNESPTVYTSQSGRICPTCGKPVDNCMCKKPARSPGDGVVRILRDSRGRKGKTVTLITGLPLPDDALHSLLSELKRRCGTGGAIKHGVLEIQGDHRETLLVELKKRGFNPKIAGG